MKPSAIVGAIAALVGPLAMIGPSARRTESQPPRMTHKTPQQQRADYEAAEFRREQRQKRNLRNAGVQVASEEDEL